MAKEYEVLAEQIAKLSSELISVRARLDRIENHYTVDGHPSKSWFTDELGEFKADADRAFVMAAAVVAEMSVSAVSATEIGE